MDRFVFYGEWLDSISHLPVEDRCKIVYDMVNYGTEREMEFKEDPMVSMAVNFVKGAIDNSKMNYMAKVEAGQNCGRGKKVNDQKIYELAVEGNSSAEIANILGISKSAVDHSEGWKNRKI